MASGEFPCWGREEALNQTQTAPTSGCRGNRLPVAQGTLCVSDGDTLGLGSIKSIQRMFGPISQAGDEDLEPLGGSAEPAVAGMPLLVRLPTHSEPCVRMRVSRSGGGDDFQDVFFLHNVYLSL